MPLYRNIFFIFRGHQTDRTFKNLVLEEKIDNYGYNSNENNSNNNTVNNGYHYQIEDNALNENEHVDGNQNDNNNVKNYDGSANIKSN
jgi:hypothetical protein